MVVLQLCSWKLLWLYLVDKKKSNGKNLGNELSYRESNKVMFIWDMVSSSTYFWGVGSGGGLASWPSAPQMLFHTNADSAFLWEEGQQTSPAADSAWFHCSHNSVPAGADCTLLQDTRGWLQAFTRGMCRNHCTVYPVPGIFQSMKEPVQIQTCYEIITDLLYGERCSDFFRTPGRSFFI